MPQLLVRDIPQGLVQKLKWRAPLHGVSTEEEHRRILRAALASKRPATPTLIEFLFGSEVAPKTTIPLERSKSKESRDIGF